MYLLVLLDPKRATVHSHHPQTMMDNLDEHFLILLIWVTAKTENSMEENRRRREKKRMTNLSQQTLKEIK